MLPVSKFIKKLYIIIIFLFVIILSFIWGGYTIKTKTFPYEIIYGLAKIVGYQDNMSYESDRYWAKKIKNGGYILHFRHAQREKWNEASAFDAYEIISETSAENSSFARATCLTSQGIEESKLIGKVFDHNNILIDKVVSSPSCRGRQTAMYAFGRIDDIDLSLLHRSAMMKEQHKYFANQLRKTLVNIKPLSGHNTVLSGHGATLERDGSLIFNSESIKNLEREETGFIVIENINGELYARHNFISFKNYVHASIMLPQN